MNASALASGGLAAPPAALPAEAAVLAQAGSENFPVASRVLPRRVRGHLLALYGWARLVDDAGDEAAGDRLALLDWLDAELERVYAGTPTLPLTTRLEATVHACALAPGPLRALIEANRQDQRVTRYATEEDLLAYCARSANPVGRLVLAVFGAATPERERLSDALCTGLQLTEHWQDVVEDFDRGRVYLPAEDRRRFGCEDLETAAPPQFATLMTFEAQRARDWFDRGLALVELIDARSASCVCAMTGIYRRILDRIDQSPETVLDHRLSLAAWEKTWVALRSLAGAAR
jgi:squalene synthase HpnC